MNQETESRASKRASVSRKSKENADIRLILEGTATTTGSEFFRALVRNLAEALGTSGAWVTEFDEEAYRLNALAFYVNGKWVQDFNYDVTGTLCEHALKNRDIVFYPDNVMEIVSYEFYGAVSYLGAPLMDSDHRIIGHMAVIDTKPMIDEARARAIFQIFAARASAELQRLRAEAHVHEREQRLHSILQALPDNVFVIDEEGYYLETLRKQEWAATPSVGKITREPLNQFFPESTAGILRRRVRQTIESSQSQIFEYECDASGEIKWYEGRTSLLQLEINGHRCVVVVARDITDRKRAERLQSANEYLQSEISSQFNYSEMIAESPGMRSVLLSVKMVAGTDATVLITGETGTGKELIARAIYANSHRKNESLITVNCAAIPPSLIESEFFGHEKGAFTGATAKRAGRFTLADKGTVFLDEIGELPLDLQSKLLRVLQEGEFQPVGSTRTTKVDVRVIAATNCDLQGLIRRGKFREDLYYRLHVFPIELPPLRDRADDIVALAEFFMQTHARRLGRPVRPLTPECIEQLKKYTWPGNIRELQNVIERAVITSRNGNLNLDNLCPDTGPPPPSRSPERSNVQLSRVRTEREMKELERKNILMALEATGWRVAGKNGAAQLIGINPFTLNSRMKALGIKRPGQN